MLKQNSNSRDASLGRIYSNRILQSESFTGETYEVHWAVLNDKPDEILNLENDSPALKKVLFDKEWEPIHYAALLERIECLDALRQRGCNPLVFSGDVTPVGLSAYTGAMKSLRYFQKNDVDLFLPLKEEHALGTGGSTLLHRMFDKPDFKSKKDVCIFLLKHYLKVLGNLPKDDNGMNPFETANVKNDPAMQACLKWMAEREKRILEKSNPKKKDMEDLKRRRI